MRWFALAALAALAFALPAQAAAPISDAQLALMPLPKSALGKTGAGLPLALDSGPVSNAEAARNSNGQVSAKVIAALGRLTGYSLDYGNELSGAPGVTRVATEVDVYKDTASAIRGLAFWKADELNVKGLEALGMTIALKPLTLPSLGDDRFAFGGTITIFGLKPIYGVDAYFRSGRLLVEASVVADEPTANALVVSVLRQTKARVEAVLAGTLHEKPVALPSTKPGPPPNGPDLSKLTVQPADLGAGKVASHGYVLDKDFSPVSEYHVTLQPAGVFSTLQQSVMLLHTTAEAANTLAALHSFLSQPAALKNASFKSVTITQVPVSAGDEARGEIVAIKLKTGPTVYEAITLVRIGALVQTLTAATPAKVPAAVVKSLAKLGATRLAKKTPPKKPNVPTS